MQASLLPLISLPLAGPLPTSINLKVPVNSTHDTVRFTPSLLDAAALAAMLPHYEAMPVDPYLQIRTRRFAKYRIDDLRVPELTYVTNVFMQSAEYNDLVKDGKLAVIRRYEPLEESFAALGGFRTIVAQCAADMLAMGAPEGTPFEFGIHAIRTLAPGMPTPEGVHRDGYAFVMSTVIGREGIQGGHSRVHTGKYDQEIVDIPLKPGDALVVNDDAVFHSVSNITVLPGVAQGHRDVLVIVARPWGHHAAEAAALELEGSRESPDRAEPADAEA